MRLPDRIFTLALLRRALYLWVGVRLLTGLAGSGISRSGLLPLPPRATVLLVLIVGLLGILEMRRRNEHLLLANFGVSQALLAVLCLLPPLIAETLVALITRA
jgi:hypothetical protein